MKRNTNLSKLSPKYLFPDINLRKREFLAKNPNVSLISLGIGDTTEPVPVSIVDALKEASSNLGLREKYSGYSPEQGSLALREKISSVLYSQLVKPEEIFISDGAKCDLGRIQMLFGNEASIAVQDPTYPVYTEGSILQGVKTILFMPCCPGNHFFPDLEATTRTDLIYFCSPNNPTGAAATKSQLESLVNFAIKNRSIIIFDSAYSCYIRDDSLPKSIFEIEGAKNVAVEVGSFSKMAGFTGVRLGWTVVPEELTYDDGISVKADWNRITSTIFNGASNIAQKGGIAVLEERGMNEVFSLTSYYLANAEILKKSLLEMKLEVFGGENAPYLWVRFKGKNSWEIFEKLLEECHLITIPGSGFGPSGDGFIRLSAFGHREQILEAAKRLKKLTI